MGANWNSRGAVKFRNKSVLAIWTPPDTKKIPYRYYEVEAEDVGRLDFISYKVYGTEEHFWVIAAFNSILEPQTGFTVGQTIKIPDLHAYLVAWRASGFNPRP